jgi:hypothetical protein
LKNQVRPSTGAPDFVLADWRGPAKRLAGCHQDSYFKTSSARSIDMHQSADAPLP